MRENRPATLPSDATTEQIIAAACAKLMAKYALLPQSWNGAKEEAKPLSAMAEAKLKTLGTELSETLGLSRVSGPRWTTRFIPRGGWGKHARKESGAGVEAWGLSIDAGFNSEIIVALDTFSRSRTGLCAAFAAYKQRSEFTFIEPAFFINFRNASPRG